MNKKGMTLIELLVYMAIAALLLAPVIMLMQNSSVNMARDAVTTDLRISGRDILNIMYEDIRNTGFKLKDASGARDSNVAFIINNPMPPPYNMVIYDSSSFQSGNAGPNGAFDTLTIRKGRLDNGGSWLGYYVVKYYVSDDSTLIRESTKFDVNKYDFPVTEAPRKIARPVEALQFQYSADLSNWEDTYSNNSTGFAEKTKVRYIKIAVVTMDKKKLAPTKTFSQIYVGDYSYGPFDDQYLRELSEIVVPIPNNGLFP
jgi:prepilin-type N-terminal cleavage/methylation domain-containing protein